MIKTPKAAAATTAPPANYRVTMPLIQVQGHVPFTQRAPVNRHLHLGDIVPAWVPAEEIGRLLEAGCIEASA